MEKGRKKEGRGKKTNSWNESTMNSVNVEIKEQKH